VTLPLPVTRLGSADLRSQNSGTQSSNSTKHGIWSPWGWSNEWTETGRGKVTKRFL